ncbi:hypothetical protein L9F63_005166, partial [Diploptera punctata]
MVPTSSRGSDELLSQSGAVSNGSVMSPQPNHSDNNNDAKKILLSSQLFSPREELSRFIFEILRSRRCFAHVEMIKNSAVTMDASGMSDTKDQVVGAMILVGCQNWQPLLSLSLSLSAFDHKKSK